MKRFYVAFTFLLIYSNFAFSQSTKSVRHKMALFTPLHIDEAFDNVGSYMFSGTNFPKQSINGLEFYHGAAMAIDSLNALNLPLDVYIYDTKSKRETLEQQFSKCAADGVELIIANGTLSELTTLARLGADKKITVINATVPNDANTVDNPYFVVINPTIQTQLESLYNYLKSNYFGKKVTLITRKQSGEQFIRTVFETLNKHYKDSVNISFREVNDEIALKALGTTTQPTQSGIFIVGSLDIEFGKKVLKQFSENSKNYASLTVIGMPTWENINLSKQEEFEGVEIVYSTPFYHNKLDVVSKNIINYYNKKMFARPSDLVFRAYSLTFRMGNLLHKYGKNIDKNLQGSEFRTFYDMNIQPDYSNGKISHYENKKLYYLTYLNGVLKSVK